jgi:hypothetical protein
VRQLERGDTDQSVEVQEPGHLHGGQARPVAHRRQVGDRQVVDVHRLVVALVAGWIETERLEDGLIDAVQNQRREDRGQGESRDQQRDEEPRPDHRKDYDLGHSARVQSGDRGAPAGSLVVTRQDCPHPPDVAPSMANEIADRARSWSFERYTPATAPAP